MAMRAFAHCQEFMVQFCYSALNQIDSRQIASFVLLSIFVVYLVNKSGISTICHGAWQVVKAVVRPIVVIPVLIVFLYSIGVMAIAYDCALWSLDISLDVVIEIIVVGIPLAITSACESRTLRQAVVNMVGPQLNLSAILEFYCGLVSFALPTELIIQACLSFLIGAKLLSRKEWGTLSAVIEGIIGLFGITLVCMVATVLIGLRTSIDWHAVFQSVAMTFWYPLALLPMVFMLAYFSSYQLLWMRLKGCEAVQGFIGKLVFSIALFPSLSSIARFSRFEAEETMHEKTALKRVRYICRYRYNIHRRVIRERSKAAMLRKRLGKPGFVEGGVWGDSSYMEDIKGSLWTIIPLQKNSYAQFGQYGEKLQEQIEAFTPMECTCGHFLSKDCKQIAVWMTNPTGFTFGLALENGEDRPLAYEGDDGGALCSKNGLTSFRSYDESSLVNWHYLFTVDRSYL